MRLLVCVRLQVVAQQGVNAASVRLGTCGAQQQAQLDGFKSRVLRVSVAAYHHQYDLYLYATEWRTLVAVDELSSAAVLLMGGSLARAPVACHATHMHPAVRADDSSEQLALIAVASGQGVLANSALRVLESALVLMQAHAAAAHMSTLWLVGLVGDQVAKAQQHASLLGLARTARAEVPLPVGSIDAATTTTMLVRCSSLPEPEVLLRQGSHCVPRLASVPSSIEGMVRLHFHARGAISNLCIESQAAIPHGESAGVLLRVRAVGLNFRDVLNVLGEYPGDPGPPGGDAAGVVAEANPNAVFCPGDTAFGLGQAPLASMAVAAAPLLTHKPSNCTFEQACTLPVVWSTTHVAMERAGLHMSCLMVVHAAAGGVGLKAVEYGQWLCAASIGTAGRPHKHAWLRSSSVIDLCSSRDGGAFAAGAMRLLTNHRMHMVLNSLSLDFITASFASLGEGGAFEEIGKRGIWAAAHHVSAVPSTRYCAIALDADMAGDPMWMHGILHLLSVRAGGEAATSLPLQSFGMVVQHELAFRTLQSGLITGKIVVRVPEASEAAIGSHIVTGGTGGLGLLTGRWLAQRGGQHVVLASRSGAVVSGSATEWDAMLATTATAILKRCDTAEATHIRRLIAWMSSQPGVWHAAGVLADRMLPNQNAPGLASVCAPKAHGAWALHTTSIMAARRPFALFSSVAALLGGAGQANYSAANASLDALACHRRAYGVASTSMQWGAWAEIGMAARGAASERTAAMEAASGFGRIGLAEGLAALGTAVLPGSQSVLGMIPIAWSRFLGGRAAAPAFLSAFAQSSSSSSLLAKDVGSEVGMRSASGISLEAVLEMVKRTAGGVVDADAPLMEGGVDSLGAVELRNQLQSAAGQGATLPSTLVFDHPTARQLALLLEPQTEVPSVVVARCTCDGSRGGLPAVFSGTSTLLPGGAASTVAARLLGGAAANGISEVPLARWDAAATSALLPEPIASRTRHGGFVNGAELTDNVAFAVSPAEATAMDPCQWLVLEYGYAALRNASLIRGVLNGSLMGVFLGFATVDFSQLLAALPAGGSVYAATGSSGAVAAGRLSFTLGLHGPCATYDTACSAALVASHAGLRAIQLAECSLGLIIGVMLMLAPSIGTAFAAAGMTSMRGRSHTFDAHADGYARGEACGGSALRRGINDGVVLGLLGSAVRQDGRSASLTAPNGQAQHGLLIAAARDARTSVHALEHTEAHGTGTALGDPIEARALAVAARNVPPCNAALVLGGIKASIGHSEPAAGMTGLLTLALKLQIAELLPNAQLRLLNPYIVNALCSVAYALPTQVSAVTASRAGVSSFGYSGTLAHTVLHRARGEATFASLTPPHLYRRCAFAWWLPEPSTNSSTLADQSSYSPQDADLCIVGAGAVGLIIARDSASCGISSIVLEQEPVIGGVWAKNDYPGLRLQVSGASYRCFSLTPAWTRKGEGTDDVCYCPTGTEVLAYLHEMAVHKLISVRTSTSYICHTGSGNFTVITSQGSVSVRALVFAPGAHETTAGLPHLPIDPSKVTNGACILHSSGLSTCRQQFYAARRKFVVGSSKSAIDVLNTLHPEDRNVVWAHRGHIIFHNQGRIHATLREGKEAQPAVREQAHMGSLYLKHQEFAAAFDGMLRSGAGICVGHPLAAQPALRGGVASEASLAFARRFLPCQIIMTSLRCDDGVLQICCDDGHVLSIEDDDAAVLCTGQRAKDAGEGSYARRAQYNQNGLFHVAPFSNQTPTNGLYMLYCVITYLNGIPSAYNDGRVAAAFARQAERMETIKDRGVWARFWANMGGVQCDVAPLIFDPYKYKATGLEAHHRWCGEWYGKDVQVERAFSLLATETAETLPACNDTGGRVAPSGVEVQEAAICRPPPLLDKIIDASREFIPNLIDGMADTPLTAAGLDSLGAIELRASVQAEVEGMELPVTLVFDHPTPRAIAALVASESATVLPEVSHSPTPRFASNVGWVQSRRLACILDSARILDEQNDDIFSTIWYSISIPWLQASHMYAKHTSLQTSFLYAANCGWRWRVKQGSELPSYDSRSDRLVFTDRTMPVFYDTATGLLWMNHTVWDGVSLVHASGDRPTQHLSVYDKHVSQMHAEWEDGNAVVDRVLCGPALFDASPTFCFERRRAHLPKDVFHKITRYASRRAIPTETAWYAVLMVLALECACKDSATLWVQDPNRHPANADVFGYCTSEVGYIIEAHSGSFEQRVQRCTQMMMEASIEYRSVFPEIAATHPRTEEFMERSLGLNYLGNGDHMDSTDRSVIKASLAAEREGIIADGELTFFGKMNWIEVGGEANPLVQLSGRADIVDFMANGLLPALSQISLDPHPESVELARLEVALHTPDYLRAATCSAREALDHVLSAAVPPKSLPNQTEFAVVGSGLAGLTIAATVSVASVPYAVFEKAHSAGGQWRSNAK